MTDSDDRARGGWVQKQLEVELRRLGGQSLLDDARAEASGAAAAVGPTAAGGPSTPERPSDLDEQLRARLTVLTGYLDSAPRDAATTGADQAGAPAPAASDSRRPGPTVGPVLPGVDATVPSIARVYDFALGGKDNFTADRRAGYEIAAVLPEACDLARDCRDFVRRAVTWLVTETDIDQIVDIGSGLPTAGNVHEIAREHRAGVRVVYVDNDPVVLAHGRALLARDNSTAVIEADLRRPETIFTHPDTVRLVDTGRPFAVLASCVLHHLPDEADPAGLLETVKSRMPSGSFLAVANFVAAPDEPRAAEIERGFLTSGLGSGRFRPVAEHERYLSGLDPVRPGLVFANDWHPDARTRRDSPVHRLHLAGVGRKP